jgi:membrane protease YdiL (CAAX protease family)
VSLSNLRRRWEIRINVTGLLCAAFVSVALLAAWWGVRAAIEGRFFPPQRRRAVPWSGWEVLAVVIVVQLLLPEIINLGLQGSGFLTHLYGAQAAEAGDDAITWGRGEQASGKSLSSARTSLWLAALSFPLQVASVAGLLWITSRTRPYQLGLTTRRLGHNLLLGFLGCLAFAPGVFLLNVFVNLLFRSLLHAPEEEHPLIRLYRIEPRTLEAVLILLTAVIGAPVVEELLFRGVLQPWFASRRWGGYVALVAAFALSLALRATKIGAIWDSEGIRGAASEAWAPLFVLVMIPGYFLAYRFGSVFGVKGSLRSEVAARSAGAIYATSLLFAAAHSFAWPTPIALFFLALGLGYLAYRTQSLVGPIVLHALFNGASSVLLFFLA